MLNSMDSLIFLTIESIFCDFSDSVDYPDSCDFLDSVDYPDSCDSSDSVDSSDFIDFFQF